MERSGENFLSRESNFLDSGDNCVAGGGGGEIPKCHQDFRF